MVPHKINSPTVQSSHIVFSHKRYLNIITIYILFNIMFTTYDFYKMADYKSKLDFLKCNISTFQIINVDALIDYMQGLIYE